VRCCGILCSFFYAFMNAAFFFLTRHVLRVCVHVELNDFLSSLTFRHAARLKQYGNSHQPPPPAAPRSTAAQATTATSSPSSTETNETLTKLTRGSTGMVCMRTFPLLVFTHGCTVLTSVCVCVCARVCECVIIFLLFCGLYSSLLF
jgi:hypothetical protein